MFELTRSIKVRNIPRDTPLENLIEAFKPGRVQTKFLQSHGVVIFTFTRISDAGALKLHHGKMAKHFPGVSIQNDDGDARVEVIFLESKHVAEVGPLCVRICSPLTRMTAWRDFSIDGSARACRHS